MDSKKKRLVPSPIETEPFIFLPLKDFLNDLTEPTSGCGPIANTIEKIGIYGWDRFGRFSKANDADTAMLLDVLAQYHANWIEVRRAERNKKFYGMQFREKAKRLVAAGSDESLSSILRTATIVNEARAICRDRPSPSSWFSSGVLERLYLWGWTEGQLREIEMGTGRSNASQPPEPDFDLELRDEQIVEFIQSCRGKRQSDYIKRAAAKFGLGDSTIRKIWADGKPTSNFPTSTKRRI